MYKKQNKYSPSDKKTVFIYIMYFIHTFFGMKY